MRDRTPSLAPGQSIDDAAVYFVLNDFGQQLGSPYVETDDPEADETTVVSKILSGEYSNPVRVVGFNTAEGWSCDVTEDIARAALELADTEGHASKPAQEFVERTLGESIETSRSNGAPKGRQSVKTIERETFKPVPDAPTRAAAPKRVDRHDQHSGGKGKDLTNVRLRTL